MNSQNDSAKLTGGNVSELEMVGTMLFGSISDESTESQPYAQMKSGNNGRKVNLGSRIAPESSRQWDASESETNLKSQDASTISSPNEASTWKEPVSETKGNVRSAASARNTSWVKHVYGFSMIFMTLCVVVLGWQLFVEKKGEPKEAVPVSSTSPSEMVQMEAPMVPMIEEPMMQSSESAFGEMPVEDASKLAYSEPLSSPSASGTVGEGLNEAPVNQAYGDSVTIAEEYPMFNAELAGVTNTPAPAPVYTPAPAPAPAVDLPPTVEPISSPAPAQQYAATTWNAGESMEEVPVFNSEISSFNAAPTAPQMAPTAPQVGTMAPMPQPVPQYNAPEQSPRKLTPPTVGHIDPNAAVQPSAPVYSEAPAEEVPTFNPNLGVDGALPVSYY